MTATDIRETLHEIGQRLDVPTVDHAAFEGRVRRARTRRTAGRAGVAALALATVTAAGVGVTSWAPWRAADGPTPAVDGADDPNDPNDFQGLEWGPSQIAFTTEGLVTITDKGDPSQVRGTGIIASRILASRGEVSYVVGGEGHVFQLVLRNDGSLFLRDDFSGGPVQDAWASTYGSTVAYVDAAGRLLLTRAGQTDPTQVELPGGATPSVAAVADVGTDVVFASAVDGGIRVTTFAVVDDGTTDGTRLEPAGSRTGVTSFPATGIDIAGPTIAVQTDDGVEIHDLDGDLRYGNIGGGVGALSTDGHWYASGSTQADLDAGMSRGLWLVNARQEAIDSFPLGGEGPVLQVLWRDEDEFLVVTGGEVRTLYDCSVSSGACQERLTDDTNTLELPEN